MLSASILLLFASAADVAIVSQAVRSKDHIGSSTTVTRVMHKIGALLQSRSGADVGVLSNLRMLASKDTPGVRDSMKKALTEAVTEIEQQVDVYMKKEHHATQTAIGLKIMELREHTSQAVQMKKIADDWDNRYFNCVQDEQVERVAIEEAEKSLKQSKSNTTRPCQLQDNFPNFIWDTEASGLEFECDMSAPGHCDEQFQNYQTRLNYIVNESINDANAASARYADAKGDCDRAEAYVVEKQSAHTKSIAAWKAQRAECLPLHKERSSSMCRFGWQLQRKCNSVAEYNAIMEETDSLVQEWKTIVETKCMLSKFVAGAHIDSSALDECAKSVNYDTDVGVLLRRKKEFSDSTSVDKFSCSEESIEFGGEAWEVPQGEAPSSSEYTKKSFKPKVSLAVDTDPFIFCAGTNPVEHDWIRGEIELKSGYVLVDGNPNSDGSACGFVQEKGLDEKCEDPANASVAGTRCCSKSEFKGTGKSICEAGQCSTLNFTDSSAACEKEGMRLCQANELLAGYTSRSGCGYDHHYVWSSKKCGTEVNDVLEPPPAPAELPQAPTQKEVKRGFYVVDGNPKSKGNMCGVVQELDQICADPKESTMAGTRCCSDENLRGSSICTSGRCHTQTFAEAKADCEATGMRLCTAEELLQGVTSGTGCNYDHHYVWSNKTCSHSGVGE